MCAMNNNHFQLSSQKKLMKFELTKNDTKKVIYKLINFNGYNI